MDKRRKNTISANDIGELIKRVMRKKKISVISMAKTLQCSRTNVYKIFDKHSIDTETLMKLSLAIGFDFFKAYSDEFQSLLEQSRKQVD